MTRGDRIATKRKHHGDDAAKGWRWRVRKKFLRVWGWVHDRKRRDTIRERELVVYAGFWRESEHVAENPRLAAPGLFEIDCPECGGTGDWDRFLPEPTGNLVPCITCKGTGRVFV